MAKDAAAPVRIWYQSFVDPQEQTYEGEIVGDEGSDDTIRAERLAALRERAEAHGYDRLVVYADREHSANLAWLSGFDPATAADDKRFGLYGMQERARLIGGELGIESAPGKGATVRLTVRENDTRPDM